MQPSQQTDYSALRRPLLVEEVGTVTGIPTGPNHAFQLRHLPSRVEFAMVPVGKDEAGKVVRAPYWLPMLVPFVHAAGVMGVKPGKNDRTDPPDVLIAKAKFERKGWIFVPRPETYIDAYPCRHPKTEERGTFYCTKFDHPKALGSELILDHDDDADALWRHGLVLAGVLPKPDPAYIERKMRSTKAAANRNQGAARGSNYHDGQSVTLSARLALMEAAIRPGDPGDPLDPSQAKASPEKGGARAKA